VFDVGAHLGRYADLVFEVLPQALVHCFEPNPPTYRQLAARMGSRAKIHAHGFSDARCALPFFADSPDSDSASIHPQRPEPWHVGAFTPRGSVEVVRLDDFCREKAIETIDLLKLDIEGHELRALRGAERLLANGSVRSIQFEFGPPALAAHVTLADFFDVLGPCYEVARLVPGGAVPVTYHLRHEIYIGVNYLATLRR
jgi:FkbM family methyltransferase